MKSELIQFNFLDRRSINRYRPVGLDLDLDLDQIYLLSLCSGHSSQGSNKDGFIFRRRM